MGSFYHNQLKLPLSWWERRSLFSPFHLVNALSDVVILTGTLIKILLDYNVSDVGCNESKGLLELEKGGDTWHLEEDSREKFNGLGC